MVKQCVIAVVCLSSLMATSCNSNEHKAKKVVKEFCKANDTGKMDKLSVLYPDFVEGTAKSNEVELSKLEVTQQEDGMWKVNDGGSHIFFVTEKNGRFIIKDTKNVVSMEMSKTTGREKAANRLGMVNENSTDMEIIKAYNMLEDGSPLVEFLNMKYPQAKSYGIEVTNIRQKKEGGMGIYWIEAIATLKSGPIEPLNAVNAYFLFKDKDGNVVYKTTSLGNLRANDIDEVQGMVDLNDYPNVTDLTIELEPFGKKKKDIRDIDLLCLYAPISKADYQEFLTVSNQSQ